jgi:L-tartrate/succinate antiporter
VPLLLAVVIGVLPVPEGLTPAAWRYVAIFAAVIAALVTEPLPGPAVGLLGVTVASALLLVEPTPLDSVRWALSGFADSTVWLMFVALIFALGYQTGSAPLYFSSGYFRPRRFWTLGLMFGAMYLAVMLGLELPYLCWLHP